MKLQSDIRYETGCKEVLFVFRVFYKRKKFQLNAHRIMQFTCRIRKLSYAEFKLKNSSFKN